MLAAILLSFAWAPGSHAPAQPAPAALRDRAFFVGEMVRLIRPDRIAFRPRETATPVLDESGTRLYIGTSDGFVRCRFRGDDAWVWKAGGSILAAPYLAGETLYVPAADGKLTALNRITGEVRWETDVHEELTTTPVLADDKIFVSSSEESVTAIEAKTGKLLWKFHRDAPPGFTIRGNARPQVAHKTVFAGFADGTVAALDPADGVAKWTRAVSGTGDYLDIDDIAAPEDDSRVYAASVRAGVVALDAETGNPAWTTALPGANRLLVDGPRLYASGRGALVALGRSKGAVLWRVLLGNDRYATSAGAMSGLVLVGIERGPLLAVDATTGRSRGGFDPGSGFSAGPLVVPGGAFVISNAGVLFGLGLLP
jgi:outer membrane protein assembly factor BamB